MSGDGDGFQYAIGCLVRCPGRRHAPEDAARVWEVVGRQYHEGEQGISRLYVLYETETVLPRTLVIYEADLALAEEEMD